MGYKIGGVEVQDESINKTLENLQESHPFFRKWGLADEELSAEAAGLLNPVPDQVVDGDDLAEVNSLIRYEGGRELAPAEFGNLARYAQQLMPDISYRSVEGLHENIPAEYRKFGFEVVMDQGSPFLVTSGRNHRDEPMYFSSIPSDTSRIVSGKPPLFKDISTRTLNDGKLQLTVETNYGEVAQYTLDPHSMMGTYVEVVYSEDGEARPVHSFRVKFYETIIDEGVPMSPESEAADPGAPSEAKKSVASSKPSGPLPTDKLTQAMTESLPKQGNQVVSSYSVLEVLTMLFAGLSDAEYRDVAAKLGLAPDLKEQLAHAASVAKALKRSGQGVTVASANRVYASPNTLTEGYRELVAQYFSPEGATEQSFKNPEAARKAINQWISDNTGGLIKDLIKPGDISPQTSMALVNALYFKALWETPFDPAKTKDEPFQVAGASKPPLVPTMHRGGFIPYLETDQFQAVELPFQGGELSLVALLPKEGSDFSPTDSTYTSPMNEFEQVNLNMSLPRFKVESSLELNQALGALGLGSLLNGSADYSAMTTEPVRGVKILTKVSFEVNEAGAEGAVATAALISRGMGGTPEVNFNRSFHFAVIDRKTNTVLFSGRVDDPRKKS